ncbi:MAG: FHA domain-containing protein [Patulibacter sp.]
MTNQPAPPDGWSRAPRGVTLRALLHMTVRAPHVIVEHPTAGLLYRAIPEGGRLTVGRAPWCDIVIGWDDAVSRTHAVLERFGPLLTIEPAGQITNAVKVGGQRVAGRIPLNDAATIELGGTSLHVRLPPDGELGETLQVDAAAPQPPPTLTGAERRVAIALSAQPDATNQQLGVTLGLSVETIRTHLQSIRRKLRAAPPGAGSGELDRPALLHALRDSGLLD